MLITCAKCNSHVDTGDLAPGEIVKCRCGLSIMVPDAPVTAGKLECPNCGASVDPAHKVCEFCNTKLATVMCPKCFGAVFEGSKHCNHCGEALTASSVVHHGDKTDHVCPRCESHPNLLVEVVAGYPIERCPECEGLWVSEDIVEKVYSDRQNRDSLIAASSKKAVASTLSSGAPIKPEGYIKCPECGKMMNRTNFGRFSGVIIDFCSGHGTWYDADELHRIIEFIEAGGLEKKAQREKEELMEELRRLRSEQRLNSMKPANTMNSMGMPVPNRIASGNGALSISSLLARILK